MDSRGDTLQGHGKQRMSPPFIGRHLRVCPQGTAFVGDSDEAYSVRERAQ
jgi:hypothetical protein